ncbi:membrane protein [Actinocatenispora thailandica]|uniref:Membrane protein n=1 Tax=Actinocatenispora thailandica TaxID=227318 RepID=A0A7R7HV96_9ACTN|nr:MMPL family transporter [Actinocatenispora thailandica]BCJ32993.1 membrane protein [Actinocatenispora thailandica]
MALSRLGEVLARHRVTVLVVAVLAAALAGVFGGGVADKLSGGGFTDAHSESARVSSALADDFQAGDANLIVLVRGDGKPDDPTVAGPATRLARWAQHADGVAAMQSYWTSGHPASLRSKDGTRALITLRLSGDEDTYMNAAQRLTPQLTEHAGGLHLEFAGAAQVYSELNKQTQHDLKISEAIATPITAVLLILVFGSVVAAVLPLLIGGLSIVTTMLVLELLTHVTSVSTYALNLTTALGLGLAIDYSLFILTRFREELAQRGNRGDRATVRAAISATMHTAGRTVLFSAVTVALAMAALAVFPLDFLKSFAYGGVSVVVLAAAGALLVLPALLALLGTRVNRLDVLARWRRSRRRASPPADGATGTETAGDDGAKPAVTGDTGFWHALAVRVMRRPVPFGLGVIVILAVLGSPFWHISFGLVDDRQLPASAAVQQASQQLRDDFDRSGDRSVQVVTRDVAESALPGYARRLSALDHVARVDTATGRYVHGRRVAPPTAADARYRSGSDAWLTVVGTRSPQSDAAQQLVADVRGTHSPGHDTIVGGKAAYQYDSTHALMSRLPAAGAIVAIATLVLLFLFTGSVVLPVKAIVLNILSLTATFGAMVFVFQDGHLGALVGHPITTGYLDMTVPVLMFCIAFGLSMDYEVFLLSRIREQYLRTGDNTAAVGTGLQRTGRLITAAALLIALVLVAFGTSQVAMLKMLGIGLALAVLVDATLVRGVLVPAFMRLLGAANWWAPGPLRWLHERVGLAESEAAPASAAERDGEPLPVP